MSKALFIAGSLPANLIVARLRVHIFFWLDMGAEKSERALNIKVKSRGIMGATLDRTSAYSFTKGFPGRDRHGRRGEHLWHKCHWCGRESIR
jgi:hypothetical protein